MGISSFLLALFMFLCIGGQLIVILLFDPQKSMHSSAAKQHHAIIVPFRDRWYHLHIFKIYMKNYTRSNFPNDEFSFWIIEQFDDELFNKAWLGNVGLSEVMRLKHIFTRCAVFHDVDMVPEPASQVPYTDCEWPVQLSSEIDYRNWSVRYKQSAGGVVTMSLNHWQMINGMSNDYIGWGMEDDDLHHRLRLNGLLGPVGHIRRPPPGSGRFNGLARGDGRHKRTRSQDLNASTKILREMKRGSNRWLTDGLSDLTYKIVSHAILDGVHHLKVVP